VARDIARLTLILAAVVLPMLACLALALAGQAHAVGEHWPGFLP
jgi:hypothetical protein